MIRHSVAGSRGPSTADERVRFATALLDDGARLDLRGHVLESTPLGCTRHWGRAVLVTLLLARSADPVEADAAPLRAGCSRGWRRYVSAPAGHARGFAAPPAATELARAMYRS